MPEDASGEDDAGSGTEEDGRNVAHVRFDPSSVCQGRRTPPLAGALRATRAPPIPAVGGTMRFPA